MQKRNLDLVVPSTIAEKLDFASKELGLKPYEDKNGIVGVDFFDEDNDEYKIRRGVEDSVTEHCTEEHDNSFQRDLAVAEAHECNPSVGLGSVVPDNVGESQGNFAQIGVGLDSTSAPTQEGVRAGEGHEDHYY